MKAKVEQGELVPAPLSGGSLVAISPEALIARAIEAGTPVEALERLLAMRTQLRAEQAREAFIDAMTAFQAECPPIPKSKTARVESKNGGSYSYNYAPLDVCLKVTAECRAKHGFSHRFDTRFEDSPPAQVTVCIVSHREGHEERSEFRSPIDSGARMNVMQQSASAQTYAKRYAFLNAFGIVAEDDDDSHASASPRQQPQQGRQQHQQDRREAQGVGYGEMNPGEVRMPPRPPADGQPDLRQATCLKCGKVGTLSRKRTGGNVFCAQGKGGCGTEFPEADLFATLAPLDSGVQQARSEDPTPEPGEPTDEGVQALIALGAALPDPRDPGKVLEFIEREGYATAIAVIRRAHERECGVDCPHLGAAS